MREMTHWCSITQICTVGFFPSQLGRIVWVCFMTSFSIISNTGTPVRWYHHLFYLTGLRALLDEAWLKSSRYLCVYDTCVIQLLGLTRFLLLTGQSCCFNLGNRGRRESGAADQEKKLKLHSWIFFILSALATVVNINAFQIKSLHQKG